MSIPKALGLGALVLLSGCGPRSNKEMIQNKGSDTLLVVAQAWAERYKEVDPTIAIAVSGGGSGTGISAMINGTVDIANASRKMKAEEIEAAQKNGIDPKEFVVGSDAIVVFVHPENPIDKISFAQLADIYGEGGETTSWSQLGVDLGEEDEIVRISRQNNSGTYAYFKKSVLGDARDFGMGSRDLNGTKEVIDAVAAIKTSIGYGSLAYVNDHVKPVAILTADGKTVPATIDATVDGSYPLARPLMMYTAGEPTGKTKTYMDWVLSDAGQRILAEEGYAPLRSVDG